MIVARSILAFIIFMVGGLLFSACGTGATPTAATPPSQPEVKVIPGRDDVSSEIMAQDDELVIDIYSESGIGSATIFVPVKNRPARVILRMHLNGLEQLQMSYDDRVIEGSVASTVPYTVRQNVTTVEGEVTDIDPSSPYWSEVTIVSDESESPAKIPLESGYFDVLVPSDFLHGKYDSLKVNWIDFYR